MSDEKKTVLILGVSSFLGSNLANFLKREFKVIGTYLKNPVSLPGVLTFPIDIFNRDECQLAFHSFRPDYTIVCSGISSLNECDENRDIANLLNTNSLIYITEFCHRYRSQVIYISTSDVFSGLKDAYREIDISDPQTTLGKAKSAGEFYLEKNSPDYLIFRCCQLYGRNIFPRRVNFFEHLQRKLLSAREVTCDNFLNYGHIDVNYLAMIIELAIKSNLKNHLLQVCSSDVMSFYEFAKTYCRIFGDDSSLIKKGKWIIPRIVETSGNTSQKYNFKMIVENLENYLDITVPTIEESLNYSLKRFNGESAKILSGRISDKL